MRSRLGCHGATRPRSQSTTPIVDLDAAAKNSRVWDTCCSQPGFAGRGPARPGSFPDMGGPMTRFRTIGSLTVAGLVLAGVVATAAFTLSSPQAAGEITPPPLPDGMAPVPAGNKLFLGTHAVGTQNYVCQPSGTGVAYVLFTPQATLSGAGGVQIITHFNSPNPDEPNTDPKVVARWHDPRHVAVQGHEQGLGQGAPTQWSGHRRLACDCLAPARCGWTPERTDRFGANKADEDHLRPAAEHHWRAPTGDGL